MGKPQRNSNDPMERLEWQMDQVRQALFVLVAVIVGSVVLGLAVGMSG